MENKKKDRIIEYDFMRVVFSLLVLGIHILSRTKGFAKEYNTSWYFVNIFTNLFMICNPLFFMLSGKFGLNKKFENKEDYKKYYKSKFIAIVLPFIILSILVYLVLNYKSLSFMDFISKFIGGNIDGTYWFVYSLIGMIVFTPFFSKMLQNMNLTDKKIFFWIGIGVSTIIVTLSIFKVKSIMTLQTFAILHWHFYYLIGSFIEELFDTKKSRKVLIGLGVLAFIVQLLLERFYDSGYRLYNPSPILTFEAIGLYFMILELGKIKNEKLKKCITFIAAHTYIFYLLHSTVIKQVFKMFKFDLKISPKMNLLYAITAFIITYIITLILSIVFKYIIELPKRINNKKQKEEAM